MANTYNASLNRPISSSYQQSNPALDDQLFEQGLMSVSQIMQRNRAKTHRSVFIYAVLGVFVGGAFGLALTLLIA